jgi:chemotaxis protein methyltransferase CheR
VYATAILLVEEGLYERTQIHATDVSARCVAQAKEGVYRAKDLAAFREGYAASGGTREPGAYYTAAYDGFAMSGALKHNILFFQHDLVTDHVFGEMNVVLCRNVLMYFGEALRERVLDKLEQSIRPGGFLCLGRSERPLGRPLLEPVSEPERIYRYAP